MIKKIKEFLPIRIYRALECAQKYGIIEEIRIRKNRQAYIIINGTNQYIDIIATDEEIKYILEMISHHSLYAFKDTIINGFISLGNGIRIGLIGRASIENKAIIGIYDISEFAIRLPNKILLSCENIIELSRNNSILIYSPPGIGKTTLLRNLVFELSKGYNAKRIAVIDTRGELAYGLEDSELLVSILSLYPRRTGIEIAVRTMNAQIIVCDEIGNLEDSAAIIEAQGAGVPIIASCHGKSIQDILSHNGIRNLHNHHIFEYYIGIERTKNHQFNYNITNWREVKLDYN